MVTLLYLLIVFGCGMEIIELLYYYVWTDKIEENGWESIEPSNLKGFFKKFIPVVGLYDFIYEMRVLYVMTKQVKGINNIICVYKIGRLRAEYIEP